MLFLGRCNLKMILHFWLNRMEWVIFPVKDIFRNDGQNEVGKIGFRTIGDTVAFARFSNQYAISIFAVPTF